MKDFRNLQININFLYYGSDGYFKNIYLLLKGFVGCIEGSSR